MWFQHDGAPVHFDVDVSIWITDFLIVVLQGEVNNAISGSQFSEFSSIGHMKSLMYETPVETEEQLLARFQLPIMQYNRYQESLRECGKILCAVVMNASRLVVVTLNSLTRYKLFMVIKSKSGLQKVPQTYISFKIFGV